MKQGYAGEEFLQIAVPDITTSGRFLSMTVAAVILFWCLIVPFMIVLGYQEMIDMQQEQEEIERLFKEQQQTKQRRGKKQQQQEREGNDENAAKVPAKIEKPPHMGWTMCVFIVIGLIWSLVFVLAQFSPINYFASRQVFAVPFLSVPECESLLTRIQATAHRNTILPTPTNTSTTTWSNGFQEPPLGFHKTKHISRIENTTTVRNCELSWRHHPFTKDDREWLTELLHARVAPTLRRLYGVTLASIQLQELHVDRFEAGTKCTYRERAVDDTVVHDVAFRILLDDTFRGGDTQFWNRYQNRHMRIAEETADSSAEAVGTVLLHSSRIAYEDAHVRDGQRNVLVGRVSFVFSDTSGLSAFASYFSFSWITTRLQRFTSNQHKTYGKVTTLAFLSQLLLDILDHGICDTFFKHGIVVLVNQDNAEHFRTALDYAHQQHQQSLGLSSSFDPPDIPSIRQATWFTGNENEPTTTALEGSVGIPEENKAEEMGTVLLEGQGNPAAQDEL